MRTVLFLIALCSFHLCFAQQSVILKGQLVSNESQKPVPFASVWIDASDFGVVANEEGKFELPLTPVTQNDSLVVSSLGFETYRESLQKIIQERISVIRLKEVTYRLKEVTVKEISPETTLLTAIKRVPYQFAGIQPLELEYFYRSVTQENSQYAYLVESAFKLTIKPDRKNMMRAFNLDYRAARHSTNFKRSPLARPFVSPNVIFTYKIPINNAEELIRLINEKAWTYELDYSTQDGNLVYIIKAQVNPQRYPGDGPIRGKDWINNYIFYVRAEDYAILRIDYGPGKYAKRIQPERIPERLKLVASEDGTILFKERDNRFYPHYYKVDISYVWYESGNGKLITEGKERNEAIVQDKNRMKEEPSLIKGHSGFDIPVVRYDSAFWATYLLKDQISLDPKIIQELEARYHVPIHDQFQANSLRWDEKDIKKAYKEIASPVSPALHGNVTFELKGYEKARFVSVTGDFNAWNPLRDFLSRSGNGWIGRFKIHPGKYRYKFVIDGKMISDPGSSVREGSDSILAVD
jgi:hypothetical protein